MRSKIVFLLSLHHIEHTPDIDISCSEKKQGQDVDINSGACSDQCQLQPGSTYFVTDQDRGHSEKVTYLPFLPQHQSFVL